MRVFKVVDGVVTQSALFDLIEDGWVASQEGAGIGWIDNGDGTFSAPDEDEISLEDAQATRHEYVNNARNQAIISGVTYGVNVYDSDAVSRENITGLQAAISNGYTLPDNFTWRTADNTDVSFSQTDINALSYIMLDHVNDQYVISWGLKDNIDAATTAAAVNAITWPV